MPLPQLADPWQNMDVVEEGHTVNTTSFLRTEILSRGATEQVQHLLSEYWTSTVTSFMVTYRTLHDLYGIFFF